MSNLEYGLIAATLSVAVAALLVDLGRDASKTIHQVAATIDGAPTSRQASK